MKNEEIVARWDEIEKSVSSSLPNIWIKFSLPKKQVDNIPDDAETTPRKVCLYYSVKDDAVYFSNNNEPYVNMFRWGGYYSIAEVSKKYDNIIMLSTWHVPLHEQVDNPSKPLFLKGKAPFQLKLKTEFNYLSAINKDKTTVGKSREYNYDTRKYEWFLDCNLYNTISREYGARDAIGETTIGLTEAFVKAFGIGLIGGNTYTDFSDIKLFPKFLSYKEPMKRETKRQKLIDELLQIELKVPKMEFSSDKSLICVASKVNDIYSALRWFMPTAENKPYEISRLYVSKKDHYFCRKNTFGDYIVLNNKLTSQSFDASQVIIQDKDAFSGTKLEYFESIYKELKPVERASALYMLTVYPEFEKFYKYGLDKICKNYLKLNYQNSWSSYIEEIFGAVNLKEKNVPKILGFNKHQLELINLKNPAKKYYYDRGMGYEIKNIFGVDDCSSIDNNTFDTIFNFLDENRDSCRSIDQNISYALRKTCETYSAKVCINMLPTLKQYVKQTAIVERRTLWGGTYRSTAYVLYIYADYVNMVGEMNAAKDMRPHFDTVEDIVRMHDDAVAVYNLKKDVVELEKFTSRISVWEKWKYEKNDKFSVVVPLKPEDIATEGITLHHCVKSYINRFANGETNIVFIRKKDEIDEPFFTVEVGNKGTIEQVHGFANRNASTEPGLEEFVFEWAKACKLKTSGYNKIR